MGKSKFYPLQTSNEVDIIYGKKRYQNCQAKKALWLIDTTGKEYQDCIKAYGKMANSSHAEITYAQFKSYYLLGITLGSKDCLGDNQDAKSVSRFQLDACEKLSESQFKERLLQINAEKAQDLLGDLNISL